MDNLLTKCNADVFAAILDIKEHEPIIGKNLINILQKHEYSWEIPLGDVLCFSAHLPLKLWDRKAHTFQFLFQSKPTTTMP